MQILLLSAHAYMPLSRNCSLDLNSYNTPWCMHLKQWDCFILNDGTISCETVVWWNETSVFHPTVSCLWTVFPLQIKHVEQKYNCFKTISRLFQAPNCGIISSVCFTWNRLCFIGDTISVCSFVPKWNLKTPLLAWCMHRILRPGHLSRFPSHDCDI